MNKKGFVNIILVIIIIVLVGLVGYFAFVRKPETLPATQTPLLSPELTRETALSLLEMECSSERVPGERNYSSCSVDISKEKDHWVVTITYDGLQNDSIKASRTKTIVMYRDGQWIEGETFQTQQCWPGRGHQDFSVRECI